MGIPYYFASLIRQHKGIVQRAGGLLSPDVLAIDFNCLIHQYMDDTDPINSIIVALRDILTNVCKATKFTYIAMDGLVPYAKIVQQRYRRFRIPDKPAIFDRHQISPETPYMKELASAVLAAFPSVILSGTSEPGEGEHKLLNWLKSIDPLKRRSICVYGLDADLILLCLAQKNLSYPHSFNLLRESSSFGKEAGVGYSTLSIWKLADKIEMPIEDYIRMCILCFGNDFMPSLGMFSLREGGHDRAIKCADNFEIGTFLEKAAEIELEVLLQKVESRERKCERAIVARDGYLLREKYNLHILDGVSNIRPVVEAFWKTYNWTVQYFLTNEVPDWCWVYPYSDAPLVCQLLDIGRITKDDNFVGTIPYTVTNQLQFILPSKSLRTTKKRVLFPDEFYNEETESRMPWMKRYAWESRPRISLPWNPIETQTKTEVLPFEIEVQIA